MLLRSGRRIGSDAGPGPRPGKRRKDSASEVAEVGARADIHVSNVSAQPQCIYYSRSLIYDKGPDVKQEEIPSGEFIVFNTNGPVYIKVNTLESNCTKLTANMSFVCTDAGFFPLKKI